MISSSLDYLTLIQVSLFELKHLSVPISQSAVSIASTSEAMRVDEKVVTCMKETLYFSLSVEAGPAERCQEPLIMSSAVCEGWTCCGPLRQQIH